MTPEQSSKIQLARRIPGKWPITRRNKISRGLVRRRNECYRLSSLQTLLHLPKFMSWILSHPDCNLEKTDCFICHLKTLIKAYWGKQNLDSQGSPLAFKASDPVIAPIHESARKWYQEAHGRHDPGAADAQQDAEDFVKRVLQACKSKDTSSQTWIDQSSALWDLTLQERRICPCGERRESSEIDYMGFASEVLHPHSDRVDDLEAMINRFMAGGDWPGADIDLHCSHCGRKTQHKNDYQIIAAPTYLMCSMRLSYPDIYGTEHKNMRGHRYPMILDLTSHQADPSEPLRYKLQSVVAHQGRFVSQGHYVSTVRGYTGKGSGSYPRGNRVEKPTARDSSKGSKLGQGRPIYKINDSSVTRRNEEFLTTNPSEGCQSAVLVYSRIDNPSPNRNRREGIQCLQQQPNKSRKQLYELRWGQLGN